MDEKRFELALIYGAYDYENATEIKSFLFETKKELKARLKDVLESKETDLYRIEISVDLVDTDNDNENLTCDIICEIDYQKYLKYKEFLEA